MMASFVRQGILAVFFATALFSTSCEKHPIGQMPEVQREQPDPSKEWSEASKKNSQESSSRPQPAEPQDESR
jgi:hypothetical protein